MTDITKAEFMAYEEVRKRGRFNMFDPRARLATGLSREKYLHIISNYESLAATYGVNLD